jgi:hypothetical protein
VSSSQVFNNVLLAVAAASFLLGVISLVRRLPSRSAAIQPEVSVPGSRHRFGILQVAIGFAATANWILALTLIARSPQPLLDGWLLEDRAAGLLVFPLLILAIWLVANSREARLRGARRSFFILASLLVAGVLGAAGMAIKLLA